MPLSTEEPQTGAVSDIMRHLASAIGQYKGIRTEFQVGLTFQPSKRWQEHEPHGWKDMILVYYTPDKRWAQKAEELLIENGWQNRYIKESWDIARDNVKAQGSHEGFYVYVVLA